MRFITIMWVGCFLLLSACQASEEPPVELSDQPQGMVTETRSFDVNGQRLSGLLDMPENGDARALVILIHGYGQTNVVEQNWYYDLRSRFAATGISSFVWDKPGCGDSEGSFDADQPVASSADEVLAAAAYLRDQKVPGAQRIGLWGISRAGWIAPLALSQDEDLAFWISVSGVDADESFGYLLESNWRIEGYDEAVIARLLTEWRRGTEIVVTGGSYEDYLSETEAYRTDPFVLFLQNGEEAMSEAAYNSMRATWQAEPPRFNPTTGLRIYIEGFASTLSKLNIPVLALFGEQDMSVDWQSTKSLYEDTVGQNPNASLTVRTFPNANHNLHVSQTGGFEEMISILGSHEMAPGYYDTILEWLDNVAVDE